MKYVQTIRTPGRVDIDEQKIRQVFGDRTELDKETELASEDIIVEEENDIEPQTSFSNTQNGPLTHVVQRGDTLFAIARYYGISPKDLIQLNSFLDNRALFVGDRLTVRPAGRVQKTVEQPKKTSPTIANIDPNKKLDGPETSSADNTWKKKQVVTYKVKKYTIKKGDTLSTIARNHKVGLAYLLEINNMKKTDILQPNQVIFVEKLQTTQNLKYRQIFVKPVEGRLSSGFGRRRNPFVKTLFHFHKGIDLAAVIGTQFRAARDGIVVYSGRMQGYGNVIFVRHKDNYITIYGHNKQNLVKNGDIVRQGQTIGLVGRTGIATGPHLHFEVRKMDEVMNPFVALKMQEVISVSTETAHR
ncbi:MAG: M23 family metallopeptidase [Leptonema sp. (in: Bacteria)]|nr:M23 family metallopeptidase [Leptonema sp. (in: bacteria)]